MKGRLHQKTSMKSRWRKIRHKNLPKRSEKSRRLPGSPDDFLEVKTTLSEDFQEVQTTSRRLPDDFQTTFSRSEKPAYPKTFKSLKNRKNE
uniref:Uncharacterized protein n=1 Tax=Brassica oleracea var. oleracea TaxID=109376 RepID=A0A0D3D101_BRAOL